MEYNPQDLVMWDRQYVWHPFTVLDEWMSADFDPVFIKSGEGVWLTDELGKRYLDGNSSIWTNLHGHRHPHITHALEEQLKQVAHVSYLGLGHASGATLAKKLCELSGFNPGKVFYSDDGSTAIEAALKILVQYHFQNGGEEVNEFISLGGGYHGDTVGAMSLGQSGVFHKPFRSLMFTSHEVMAPGCYRCPFNKACPEKADARTYRKCEWECVDLVQQRLEAREGRVAGLVLEPKVQGAAGMLMHPEGYLKRVADLAKTHGVALLLDEVFTGFGRTGSLFAFQSEAVEPDFVALGKGLSGGYLPFAATLVRDNYFEGFRGGVERTFFHGHSYSGNLLGCAAALANLEIFERDSVLSHVASVSVTLNQLCQTFWSHPNVGDVRQEGLIVAIELVRDPKTREPFAAHERLAHRIGLIASKKGLLVRGLGNILFLIPPLCVTVNELEQMVSILRKSLDEVLV